MREIDGMSYADLAGALDVTVPAVKSLLVRARIGLVEAAEARDADCTEIRHDLTESYDRGVKASGRARRHMRTCDGCREYRTALRGIRRSFAALNPLGAGPLAMAGAKLLGFGGAGGGAAAGGSAVTGGGAAVTGGVATVSACKVAAVVCTAALTAGGAVEVRHLTGHHKAPERAAAKVAAPAVQAPARPLAAPLTGYQPSTPPVAERTGTRRERVKRRPEKPPVAAPPAETPVEEAAPVTQSDVSGGTQAPPAVGEEPAAEAPATPTTPAETEQPPPAAEEGGTTGTPPADPGTGTPPTEH
jgi:hypothetical protein